MAGGGGPRQRMINLMYLVFIAMLALNMGKEVLNAFGLVNEKFEASNIRANATNIAAIEALQKNASENAEKYAADYEKAKQVKALSDSLYNFIQGIKDGLNKEIGQEDKSTMEKDYQAMDKSEYTDNLFFKGEGYNTKGQEFVKKIEEYRTKFLAILGDAPQFQALANDVKANFNTDPVKTKDGTTQKWLNFNFEGFPYIASLAKLSMMQSDIRTTGQEFYGMLLEGNLKAQISMTNYTTLLEQGKGAYYQGEAFDGAIVLGRKDASTKPNEVELSLDGRKLSDSEFEIQDGKVKLKVSAGNAGEHRITGNLHFDQDGERISVAVDQTFSTIPKPNAAVISADKMNVVYRGVSNPITISMPGVPDNKVSASAPGLSRVSGTSYAMNPGQGREVTINVVGEIDGQKFPSSRTFRIKNLPRPVGKIGGETGTVKLPKNSLGNIPVEAEMEDFDFDLKVAVKSFKVSVPGQPSVQVNGNRFNDQARSVLNRAKRGDIVQIFDISADIVGNSGYHLPKVAPIAVEITN